MEVADSQTILSPGDKLGCYRIDSFLGQGGFGVTYLARDTMLDLQVAIKEYLPEKISERTTSRKVQPKGDGNGALYRRGLVNFLKEARTLARFKHPNIVRVMSVFELNGTAYMVMEYERGHDLKVLFNRREQISENQLKTIVGPIIDGLDEVHRHGFIHRDIKPANILVRDNGSPVLLDFGSARLAVGQNSVTMTAMVTVGFAPLEQYSGLDEQQGPWTDIYALGAVLYYAVTGEAPLDSTLRGASVLNDKPDPLVPLLISAPVGYSQDFCRAVDWALQFKVSERPKDLQQWRSQLFAETHAQIDAAGVEFEPTVPVSRTSLVRPVTLSAPEEHDLDASDAPTVLRTLPFKNNASQLRSDENGADFENAQTVLIEDDWDMADINPPNEFSERSSLSTTRLKLFPLILVLSAALLLTIFRPWRILQDDGPVNAVDAAQTLSSSLSVEQTDINGAAMDVGTHNSDVLMAESQTSVVANSASDQQIAVLNSSGSSESEQTAINTPSGTTAQTSISVSEAEAEQQEANRQAQLELDRAVQRAESRRMAALQAREAEAEEARRLRDLAAKRRAENQARLAAEEVAGSRKAKADAEAESSAEKPLISNADMVDVLTRFNALSSAIENGDGEAMRQVTVPSERKYAYFDYVFRTFDKVEARVSNISASRQDQKIQAILTIDRMFRNNGDIAIPPNEFNNIPIYAVKERQWSEIHW